MMLYICTKFHQNISKGLRVIEELDFQYSKLSKGHNSVKNVGEVIVLGQSANPLMMLYICTKCHENISKCFRFIEGIDFHYLKFSKGYNSVKM